MALPLHHFFHVYAAGAWEVPVKEHIDALDRSGLGNALSSFSVGIVGSGDQADAVMAALDGTGATAVAFRTEGWEQVTLAAMYEWVHSHDGLVCYTHTKGASRDDPIDGPWRRDMTYHCVGEWRRIVAAFEADECDVAGAHWITERTDDHALDHAGFFGGNFWWVSAQLLRRNDPPKVDYRHRAEEWLGDLGRIEPIRPLDLCPCHPSELSGGGCQAG